MQKLAFYLFLLGLFVTGLFGTETRLLLFWPGSALLGLAGVVAVLRWKLRVTFQPHDFCLLTVLLFAVYAGWRQWTSPVEVYAREDAVILLACFVAYLMTVTAVSLPKWRLGIVCVLLVVAAGDLTAGWLNFQGRWDFHLVPGFSRSFAPGRIGGFFNNPNHLAAFLSFVIFLSAGVVLFARIHVASRLLLAFAILAMLVGLVLTVSRGAMLGGAVGVVVLVVVSLGVVWRTHRHLFKWLVLALFLGCGGGGFALYKANEDLLVKRQIVTPAGEDIRSYIWKSAWAQHAESPWVGAGARMFYEGSVRYRDPQMPVLMGDALFAHNEFLQLLADYGWAGVGLLALLLLAHGWNGLRFLRWFVAERFPATGVVSSNSLALVVGSLAALAATLTHAVFEFHGHVAITAVLGAIVLGVLANPGVESEVFKTRRLPGLRLVMKIALLMAGGVLVGGAAHFGVADAEAGIAMLQISRGQTPEALKHLAQATRLDPRNAALAYQYGVALLDSYKPSLSPEARRELISTALAELTRAVAENPYNHLYQLALADAQDASGKTDDAMSSIQRALELAPLYEEPRIALGMHYHRLGQFEEAEFAYLWAGKAKALNPEGTTNWQQNLRQLLRHTAILAERERTAKSRR